MAGQPITVDKLCEYCKGPIPSTTPNNLGRVRYCSPKHRWLGWEEAKLVELLRSRRG